jgi:DHA1 family bicyclomycin/chloramphenicol resistance-like MFS transporter
MALALRPFGHIAGTGSSLFGFIQMSCAAFVSAAVGHYLTDSAWPMLIGMVFVTVLALITLQLSARLKRHC